MGNHFMSELAGWNADNVGESRRKHEQRLAVLESSLDIVIEGFNQFAKKSGTPQSDTERVRLMLTVRAFRAVHVALVVAQMAYYNQAILLARAAMEDLLMAEVADQHPPVLEALNIENGDNTPRFGRGELRIERLTDFLPDDFKSQWKEEYSNASKLGSHPSIDSLDTQLVLGEDGPPHLPLYGHQDEYLAAACFGFIAGRCRRLIHVLMLFVDEESDWKEKGVSAQSRIDKMVDSVFGELTRLQGS